MTDTIASDIQSKLETYQVAHACSMETAGNTYSAQFRADLEELAKGYEMKIEVLEMFRRCETSTAVLRQTTLVREALKDLPTLERLARVSVVREVEDMDRAWLKKK